MIKFVMSTSVLPLLLPLLICTQAARGAFVSQNVYANTNTNANMNTNINTNQFTSKLSSSSTSSRTITFLQSSINNDNNDKNTSTNANTKSTRREAITKIMLFTSTSVPMLSSFPQQSRAACLAGDTSTDCIGMYKVPIDPAIDHMVNTPEQLAKFAPGLRWTPPIEYPKTYITAKEEIVNLKQNVLELIPLVSKGELTTAGVELLRIVPRITVCGRVAIDSLQNNNDYEMKAMRSEVAHNELLGYLGSADILIGQSIAGHIKTITIAQIQVLEELVNAKEQYEELIKALPENCTG